MRKIELVPKVTPESAQALWYEMEAEIEAAGNRTTLVLDLRHVRHLSAAAIQVLIVARERLHKLGRTFTLASPSDETIAALRQMGALPLFEEILE